MTSKCLSNSVVTKPKYAISICGCVIIILQIILLVWSGYVHSPTHLEVFHLPAGVSHWELNRYDLYRVNPPLVRKVAALPVWLSPHFSNYAYYNSNPFQRAEYAVGIDAMYSNGRNFVWLVTLARWACIPFILLGSFICFIWAKQLYGEVSGIIAMLLWSFCPYVLAQGSLITPDAHAAALGVTVAYLFWKWLQKPTYLMALIVGIVLGIAELSKFTLLVFYPLGFILWLIFRFSSQKKVILRESTMILIMTIVSVLVINLGYDFEGTFKPLGDYRFQTKLLTGYDSIEDIPQTGGNRFAGTWLAKVPLPLPSNFVSGIDTQRKDVETGIFSYLNGEWKIGGWWYFYLEALLFKLPIGTLVLLGLCVVLTIMNFRYRKDWRNDIFLLLPALTILFIFSNQKGIGLHSRYLIPMLPFLFIWTSKLALAFQHSQKKLCCCVIIFLVWSIGSTMYYFPHEIPYCNELVGGTKNAYKYFAKSDSSWGQDLLFLKKWLDEHPEVLEIHIAHCGPFDPRLVGLEFTPPPVGRNGKETLEELPENSLAPQAGWYAIDVCFLLGGDPLSAADGKGGWVEPSSKHGYDLSYFQKIKPIGRAGYSIYIYHIPEHRND
ncbi:MAG: glycosyltransferase family 39 protein [Planctomycetaceae bacterium]|nr:glycosyltransferase family 39 protein [Planctomycetaceae bacterium]